MNLSLMWLDHASFLIKREGKNVITDPQKLDHSWKADLTLVSHSHYDHLDVSKIERLRKKDTIIIAPADCKSKIAAAIKPLKPGQEAIIDKAKVEAVEAYNIKSFRSPRMTFQPKDLNVGYLVFGKGKTIHHPGDTDSIPEMNRPGHINMVLLPSGGRSIDRLTLKPAIVMPMHHWDTEPEEFRTKVKSADSHSRVLILTKGEEYQVV